MQEAFYGILIPFLGTTLGAACVFFMKKTLLSVHNPTKINIFPAFYEK